MFSPPVQRGHRGSLVDTLRNVATNSRLSRIFSKTKSVPYLRPAVEPTRDDISDTNADFGDDDDSVFLAISPQTPQSSRHSTAIETRVLDITFPYSPSKIDEQHDLEEYPYYPTIPPPQDAHDIAGWVRFFSQSHIGASPVTEPEVDSTDEMANSSMTRMGTETCSLGNGVSADTLRNGADGEDLPALQLIGDDVVLEYILNGMASLEELPCRLSNEEPSNSECVGVKGQSTVDMPLTRGAGPERASVLDIDKALPELRHRKDPAYTELPSISLVEATPNVTATVPTGDRPPLPSLSPYTRQYALYYKEYEAYQHGTRASRAQMQVQVQVAGSVLFRGSNGSFFIEPEFSQGAAPVFAPPQGECSKEGEYTQENLARPKFLGSLLPKAGSWMHSLLRRHHSSTKHEGE